MSDFVIKEVFVFPTEKNLSSILGFARIHIEGGLFISEIRIYPDSRLKGEIYISFPTRKNKQGDERKVVYPVTNEARVKMTAAIKLKYIEVTNDSM